MVSNASEDFPEPERPVKTMRLFRGSSTVRFFRLCSRAPLMRIESVDTLRLVRLSYDSVIRIQGERLFDQQVLQWACTRDDVPTVERSGHSHMLSTRGRRKIWIVLPAYNEERDLPSLLERIDEATEESGLNFEILVVDDGSLDGTADVARLWANKLPLQVLSHPTNMGLGATLRDGLQWACELARPSDVIITLDADNTHTPELMVRMVRMVREGHDVVVASRFVPGSRVLGVPLHRRVLSRVARILFKIVFPTPGLRDYTSGYRAYRAGVLMDVISHDPGFFDQDGFQVMVDVLLKLRVNKHLIFGEVPLILRYDFKEGRSKMDVSRTSRATLGLMWKRRFT